MIIHGHARRTSESFFPLFFSAMKRDPPDAHAQWLAAAAVGGP